MTVALQTLTRRYARSFRYALRDQLAYPAAYLGRALFMAIILFVKYSLWSVILSERGALAGFTLIDIVWYLVVTETIELSRSDVMEQVEADVRDGSLAYGLVRPYSYPAFVAVRGFGQSLAKLVPILLVGVLVAWALTAATPAFGRSLPHGLVLLVGGVALNTLWHLALGMLAFWFEHVLPFRMIFQKLVFIVGGLFIPIDLFPGWLRDIFAYLPFAYQAYWPARLLVSYDAALFARAALITGGYLIALSLLVAALFALGRRRVHANGG